ATLHTVRGTYGTRFTSSQIRAPRLYTRRWSHPESTRRHDAIWIAYVANTASTESAIHPGLMSSDTCSERNSLQFRTIAAHTIRATTAAMTTWSVHQSQRRVAAVKSSRTGKQS